MTVTDRIRKGVPTSKIYHRKPWSSGTDGSARDDNNRMSGATGMQRRPVLSAFDRSWHLERRVTQEARLYRCHFEDPAEAHLAAQVHDTQFEDDEFCLNASFRLHKRLVPRRSSCPCVLY